MQINVAQLLKEAVGSARSFAVDDEIELDGNRVELAGHVSLTRLDRSILVTGEAKAKLKQICSRCLREFESKMPVKIEEEFFPSTDINTGLPIETRGEEGAFLIDENHILDLDEAFRQNLLVTLPMKPLCRPNCVGLCPECGANLNETECGCNRTPEDARWAELMKTGDHRQQERQRKERIRHFNGPLTKTKISQGAPGRPAEPLAPHPSATAAMPAMPQSQTAPPGLPFLRDLQGSRSNQD